MATKTKRKVRRFAEGGTDDAYNPDQDAADQIADQAAAAPAKSQSFADAFREARAKGKGTIFNWKGKQIAAYREGEQPEKTKPAAKKLSIDEDYARAKAVSDKIKAKRVADAASATTKANAYSSQLAREAAARSNPYGYASMYKKGGKVKRKFAEGGNVNWSENETTRMKTATPDNLKRLKEKARKAGATEEAINRAERGSVPVFAKGGGIESKGKTKGKVVKMARGGGIESRGKTRGKFV